MEEVPAQCLLIRGRWPPPYSLREISIATKECFAQAFQEKLPIFFQSGVTVPLERVRQGKYIQASHAFLPIEDTDRAENIRRLPGGKCAAIYHVGDYQSIGRSYRRLLDYCQGQGLALRSGSFEFCINDYITPPRTRASTSPRYSFMWDESKPQEPRFCASEMNRYTYSRVSRAGARITRRDKKIPPLGGAPGFSL